MSFKVCQGVANERNVKSTIKRYSIFWDKINQFFSRFFCMALLIGQTHYLDYLLISYVQTKLWWTIFIPDWTSVIIFFIYHAKTYKYITDDKHGRTSTEVPSSQSRREQSCNTNKIMLFHKFNIQKSNIYFPWGPLAWFIYGSVTSAKIIVIFTSENYGQKWESGTVRSKNGLQMAIGLTSIIFFLMLVSSMHHSVESKMKRFIHEVSATVTIDLLDTMDLLEIVYIEEDEEYLHWNGSREVIVKLALGIVVINMLIPVFPCTIVYRGWTHEGRMFRRLVLVQKGTQIVLVNVFFMSIRLVLWSIFHERFSAFIIKNILMVGILTSDIFSVYMEAHLEKKESVSCDLKTAAFDACRVSNKLEVEKDTKEVKEDKERKKF